MSCPCYLSKFDHRPASLSHIRTALVDLRAGHIEHAYRTQHHYNFHRLKKENRFKKEQGCIAFLYARNYKQYSLILEGKKKLQQKLKNEKDKLQLREN